jgi:light-harvesting protein B-800-850 alpha chain
MNQGKIWLVVKPTVGLPAFLGGVAVISLCVHASVLNHSDWFPAFLNGNLKAKAAASAAAAPQSALEAPSATVAAAPAEKSGKK